MAAVFSDKVEVVEASHAAEVETLHAKIGQFVVERDSLPQNRKPEPFRADKPLRSLERVKGIEPSS